MRTRCFVAMLALVLAIPAWAGAAFCPDFELDRVFADVPANHPFCAEIESLYRDGLTQGCRVEDDGTRYFCPNKPITRAASAAFAEHRNPFARLDESGRIHISDHVVNAERFAEGHYWVQFSRNIQGCSREAWAHRLDGSLVDVRVTRLGATVDTVEVLTFLGAQPWDMGFSVRVHCR